MSGTTYVGVRDEAVAQMRAAFPQSVTVDAHPGRFNEAEIKRLYTSAPAILTALMQIRPSDDDDGSQELEFVTWVLARASNRDRLYDAGLRLVSALIPWLKDNLDAAWSVGAANDVAARNLYSASTGQINVSLWAVSWKWTVNGSVVAGDPDDIIGEIPNVEDLDQFEGYEAIHTIGTDEVPDTVNL